MTSSIGFSEDLSYFITKSAGVGEVLFGVVLFIFYYYKPLIILNIIGLGFLLMFVVVLQPQLLVEAFNPVTTNIPIIGLSFVLLSNTKQSSSA